MFIEASKIRDYASGKSTLSNFACVVKQIQQDIIDAAKLGRFKAFIIPRYQLNSTEMFCIITELESCGFKVVATEYSLTISWYGDVSYERI